MPQRAFLLIHGFGGSDPGHWQHWLAPRLRAAGELVSFPRLPNPENPQLSVWLAALHHELDKLRGREIVVLAHSCGSLLWLHHAEYFDDSGVRAQRVLLVALPSPEWSDPMVVGFSPLPMPAAGLQRASKNTRMVAGTEDPYCSLEEIQQYERELEIPCDVVPHGKHLNVDAGYGPWSSIEQWAIHGTTPLLPR
jgi:hypothetical protein